MGCDRSIPPGSIHGGTRNTARIRQILREVPQLPEYLIEMGYEPDTSWVSEYLDAASMAR